MPADPPNRHVRCPECGTLMPLDERGRFVVHIDGANGQRPGWCPGAGREPGWVEVEAKRAKEGK